MLAQLLDACVLECTDHDEAVDLVRLIAAAAANAAGSSGDQYCAAGMRGRFKLLITCSEGSSLNIQTSLLLKALHAALNCRLCAGYLLQVMAGVPQHNALASTLQLEATCSKLTPQTCRLAPSRRWQCSSTARIFGFAGSGYDGRASRRGARRHRHRHHLCDFHLCSLLLTGCMLECSQLLLTLSLALLAHQ